MALEKITQRSYFDGVQMRDIMEVWYCDGPGSFKQVFPTIGAATFELDWNNDGHIRIAGGLNISVTNGYRLEYKKKQVAQASSIQPGLWSDEDYNSGTLDTNLMYVLNNADDMRRIHGGGGQNLLGLNYPVGPTYQMVEVAQPGGPVDVTMENIEVGDPNFGVIYSDQQEFTLRTGVFTTLTIGARGTSTARWVGRLRDFKVFNDVGTLVHHWPINDNSSTIVDVVGGVNGTLVGTTNWIQTGGGASGENGIWVEVPSAPGGNRVYSASADNPSYSATIDNPVYSAEGPS